MSDTHESLESLQAFHDARFGSVESFLWTDKAGTQHTVKFMNDTQEITHRIGHDDFGNLGIVAYETTVTLRKIWVTP